MGGGYEIRGGVGAGGLKTSGVCGWGDKKWPWVGMGGDEIRGSLLIFGHVLSLRVEFCTGTCVSVGGGKEVVKCNYT